MPTRGTETPKYRLAATHLNRLIAALTNDGYTVIGPSVKDGAILYTEIEDANQLPIGWTDEQEAGQYRLKRRDDKAYFGFNVGPQSWKDILFPADRRLWRAVRDETGFHIEDTRAPVPKVAFLGMRACELAAIAIQDRIFMSESCSDADYVSRRENAFFVAVNCGQAASTCFCASMDTGPAVSGGFDIALTEMIDDTRHDFLVESGSARGAKLVDDLPILPVQLEDIKQVQASLRRTVQQMGRQLETSGLKDVLQQNPDHPRWDEVAARCLTCGNCTMVCPTCFCTTVEDVTDLTGGQAERWRKWDTCFALDFSYLYGGSVRSSAKSRYRQWMTHKLAHWVDQFDTSGCVGCGRCITWCPVGIDITEEAAAIREQPAAIEGVA